MSPLDLMKVRGRLRHQLRVLFDHVPDIHAIGTGIGTQRPFVSTLGLHLPAALRATTGQHAVDTYAAAANHAVAHLRHRIAPMERTGLKPVQQVLYGVFADAYAERMAIAEMPGLRAQWLRLHLTGAEHGETYGVLLQRLSRALLDPCYRDPHPWVAKALALHEGLGVLSQPGVSLRALASLLGNEIGQLRLGFDARSYQVEPAYRDDNAHLWLPEGHDAAAPPQAAIGLQIENPSGASEAVEHLQAMQQPAATSPDPAAIEMNDLWHYPEWDRLIGRSRMNWSTVREGLPEPGDAALLEQTRQLQTSLLSSMGRRLRAVRRDEQAVVQRGQPDGSELDLEAAVCARMDWHAGGALSERIFLRRQRRARAGSSLFLLDTSASTAHRIAPGGDSLLELARQAALLAVDTLEGLGERCAICGFSSCGRTDIRIEVCKSFGERIDHRHLHLLAGLRSGRSTRIGAALRHATRQLEARSGAWRVGVLVTDGAPHDIDVFDPDYLIEDAAHAVQQAARRGVRWFAVGLDAAAQPALGRIFGTHGYRLLAHLDQLPEVLAGLHSRLGR